MYTKDLGEFIRELRNEAGISVRELAQAVGCDPGTLSKIENNKQDPHPILYENIMGKFGLNPRTNYDIWVLGKDYKTYFMMQKLKEAIYNKNYSDVESLVTTLEEKQEFQRGTNLQYLIYAKCYVMHIKGESDQDTIELLYEALNISINPFKEENIQKYFLSYIEVNILNMLALKYEKMYGYKRSIEIIENTILSVEKHYLDFSERDRVLPMLLTNLSSYYGRLEEHEKAKEICEKARTYFIKADQYRYLPHILFNYACSLYYTGDRERYISYIVQSHTMFLAVEDQHRANMVKEYSADHLEYHI